MSAHPPFQPEMPTEIDAAHHWAVYRCQHGCFHVVLDGLTLTVTDEEFHALQVLLRRACVRFHGCERLPSPGGRSH